MVWKLETRLTRKNWGTGLLGHVHTYCAIVSVENLLNDVLDIVIVLSYSIMCCIPCYINCFLHVVAFFLSMSIHTVVIILKLTRD
jgi:hypothetical protein